MPCHPALSVVREECEPDKVLTAVCVEGACCSSCADGASVLVQLEVMLNIALLDHPKGRFAQHNAHK